MEEDEGKCKFRSGIIQLCTREKSDARAALPGKGCHCCDRGGVSFSPEMLPRFRQLSEVVLPQAAPAMSRDD